jgi:two-component system, NtrC family, sensor histidine kinase HydH
MPALCPGPRAQVGENLGDLPLANSEKNPFAVLNWRTRWNRERLVQAALIACITACVSMMHYFVPTSRLWFHLLLERAYYVPILLGALWFGWRGGIGVALVAGILYAPHIAESWKQSPDYAKSQYVQIFVFVAIGMLVGILADHEREQRKKAEETARKLTEVYGELQRSFDELRRADRLSALGELAAGLAHEIRNPLGSIEGALQILRREGVQSEIKEEFGALAQKEIDRLKGLVLDFLDFARPQQPHQEPTDINELFKAVQRLSSESAKIAGVSIRLKNVDDLPFVSLDPEQMKQVLLNLVLNAIQAMPQGGEILLSAQNRDDVIVVEVKDQGIGVDPSHLERIFDPFFTTRAKGTGLGLSIAYRIVSQHGGHISAMRNPERGMTFTVTLPVLPGGSTASPKRDNP